MANIFVSPWVDQSKLDPYAYNPDKAKQLLKQANFPANQSLELMAYYTDSFTTQLCAAFQQYWGDVGIKSTVRQSDYTNLEPDQTAGKWDLMYQGSSAGLDPDEILFWASEPATKSALKETTDEAVRRGVFGAPTMFVGGEMFFGQDRLDFVRDALR